MNEMTPYSINEIIALVTAVLIGTGAFVGFMVVKKERKINLSFIFWILLINLFVTYIFSELLKLFSWGAYRALVLPLVAYAGQYLIEWFDKRHLKIFDAGLKKTTGLDINKDSDNDEKNHTENEENTNN